MVTGFPGTLAASTGTMIAAQQTKSICGTIVDSNGIPVIGANVLEKEQQMVQLLILMVILL